jgi:carbamoyltransferase
MLLTFKVKDEKKHEIPAVVHVDGTTRPQTLEKNTNPLFYDLLVKFEKEVNVPLVLNTSFNSANEPIVCTPIDAVKTFLKTGLDYLAIGNFIVEK